MAYKMSKKDKAEQYDKVAADMHRLDLMLFDIVNGKVVYGSWVKDGHGLTSKVRVGISWRGMPLVIVEWKFGGTGDPSSINVLDLDAYEQNVREGRKVLESYESQVQALASAKEKLFASLGVAA